MRYGEVYAYRTRKPHAVLGLPVIGRHWGYGGKTRNPRMRHQEHMTGIGRYGVKDPQPWSDLDPRRYVLFRMRHCPDWLLSAMEWLVIHLIWPVYNVQMNRWNPRRIKPRTAKAQRAHRDATGRKYSMGRALARIAVYLLLAAVVAIVVHQWVQS